MNTLPSRPGQGSLTWAIRASFSTVQTITTAATSIQGSHPCQAGAVAAADWGAGSLRMAKAGSGAGFQTLRKAVETTSDTSEAKTSVRA